MNTLVLLSGLLSDDVIWSEVAARLAPRYRTVVVSFPGFDSIGGMARHVLECAPPSFALAGHSMGGRVALEVLRQAPERVLGLALCNTGTHPPRAAELQSRGRLVDLARTAGMTALAEEWLPPMMGASDERVAQLLPLLRRMVERSTPDSFAAQTKALLERPDGGEVLSLIEVPTLLVSGTRDSWSPLAQHEVMQACIPGSELVAIEDAGHMAPIEQPAAVAAAIEAWLSRCR